MADSANAREKTPAVQAAGVKDEGSENGGNKMGQTEYELVDAWARGIYRD